MFEKIFLAQVASGFDQVNQLLFREDYKSAIKELIRIIERDSINTEAYYKLALAYQGNYQNSEAVAVLHKAIKYDSNTVIMLSLAKSYYNLGYIDKAEKIYSRILKTDSSNNTAAINVARIFQEKQKYPEALRIYNDLLKSDSVNTFLYKQLAYCFMKLDSLDHSLRLYKKSLDLNPDDMNSSVQMATICFKLGRLDSALQYVDYGLLFIPSSPGFNKLKADILFKKEHYCKAKDLYQRTISCGDSSVGVYQKLGLSFYFYAAGEDSTIKPDSSLFNSYEIYDKALNAFEEAFKLESNNPITCYYAGLTCDKIGYHDLEIFYFNEALSLLIPEYTGSVYKYLGRAYQVKEKYNESIECYKQALLYDPDHKDLLFYIGAIFEDYLKDSKEALKYYQSFLNEKGSTSKDLREFAERKINALNKR